MHVKEICEKNHRVLSSRTYTARRLWPHAAWVACVAYTVVMRRQNHLGTVHVTRLCAALRNPAARGNKRAVSSYELILIQASG